MRHASKPEINPLIAHSILSGQELSAFVQTQYALTGTVECSLFAIGVNDIYRVTASGRNYILRVSHANRFGAFDEAAYQFELDLVNFLHAQDFPLSYVIPNVDQKPFVTIEFPEGKRRFVLFSYAKGQLHTNLTTADAELLGATLGRLHKTLDQFRSPYQRFELDDAFLIDEPLRRLRQTPGIAAQDLVFLESLAPALKAVMQQLPRTPEGFGPIHGDYWWHNIHFHEQGVTLFDFDFCGNGWRLYDIAALQGTARVNGFEWSPDIVGAFLEGYESFRILTDAERCALGDFEAIRVIWALGLAASLRSVRGDRWFSEFFHTAIAKLKC